MWPQHTLLRVSERAGLTQQSLNKTLPAAVGEANRAVHTRYSLGSERSLEMFEPDGPNFRYQYLNVNEDKVLINFLYRYRIGVALPSCDIQCGPPFTYRYFVESVPPPYFYGGVMGP